MNRPRRRRVLAGMLVLGLVAAACGSDDSGDGVSSTEAPDTTTATTGTSAGGQAPQPTTPDEASTPGTAPTATEPAAPSALGEPDPATGTPVRIGLINNEGGVAIDLPEAREAAEAAVAYANEHLGGLGGHEIELVTCAEGGDATTATACANQMVQDDVAAVVVTVSGQGDAMVPIITGAGIPYVTASGGAAAELTSANVFLWTSGIVGVLGAWAQYAADNDISDLTVFAIDVPTATLAVDVIARPAFERAGVGLELAAIAPGTADATPQVNAALSGDPGAVAIVGDGTFCQAVLSALQTAAAEQPTFILSTCLDPAVVEGAPGALDGTIAFLNAATIAGDDETELFEAALAEYAPDVDPTAAIVPVGWQSMLGLIRAGNAGGGLEGEVTPDSIIAAITSASDVPVPLGAGSTFTCDGTVLPAFANICSAVVLARGVQGDQPAGDAQLIDPAPLLNG